MLSAERYVFSFSSASFLKTPFEISFLFFFNGEFLNLQDPQEQQPETTLILENLH